MFLTKYDKFKLFKVIFLNDTANVTNGTRILSNDEYLYAVFHILFNFFF